MNTKKLALPTIEEFFLAGVHFGHKSVKWHPKMKPYISNTYNSVHMIDLEQTIPKLEAALTFMRDLMEQKKIILFVGTGASHRQILKETALSCTMPYINERWIGGLLTNFKIINKRLDYFRDLEKKKTAGELEKYTKKEQHEFDKELERLIRKFSGVKNLNKIPDALFVVNCGDNLTAIREARRIGVPVIGLVDTNINPTLLNYPIPSNDDAYSAVKLILDTVVKNITNFL